MADEVFIAEASPAGIASSSPPPAEVPVDTNDGQKSATGHLQNQVQELQKAFDEFSRRNLPEIDRVRQELASTAAERDNAAVELKKLRRENAIKNLAEHHGFTEVEFLDFILHKNRIEPVDTVAAEKFMQQFKSEHPRYFALPVKAGSGSRPGSAPEKTAGFSGSRMDALENMLSNAREIY